MIAEQLLEFLPRLVKRRRDNDRPIAARRRRLHRCHSFKSAARISVRRPRPDRTQIASTSIPSKRSPSWMTVAWASGWCITQHRPGRKACRSKSFRWFPTGSAGGWGSFGVELQSACGSCMPSWRWRPNHSQWTRPALQNAKVVPAAFRPRTPMSPLGHERRFRDVRDKSGLRQTPERLRYRSEPTLRPNGLNRLRGRVLRSRFERSS